MSLVKKFYRSLPAEHPSRGLLSDRARKTRAGRITVGVLLAFLFVIAAINVFPVYWVFASAMKTDAELLAYPPTLIPESPLIENYLYAWTHMEFQKYFLNTLIMVGGTVFLRVLACALAAYALSRLDPPFKKTIMGMILALLMVPGMAYLVPQFVTVTDVPFFDVNLLNTWWAIWLPNMGAPVLVYLFKGFFDQLPDSTFEAAKLDGAGSIRVFTQIVLPLSRPIVAVGILISAISAWQEFLWPLLVLMDSSMWPLELGLYRVRTSTGITTAEKMGAMAIATIPLIILFLIFQRHIVKGVAAVGK